MSEVKTIDAVALQEKILKNEVLLIDVRENDEFSREHISNAISIPLSQLEHYLPHIANETRDIVFQCQKGKRGENAANKALDIWREKTIYNLTGGIEAWQSAGYEVVSPTNTGAKLPINRQVFIAAGSLIIFFSLVGLGSKLGPLVTLLMGSGLLFAGITGWCGMALLLKKMPWNKGA